ncbi:MAG TPA: CPBP family intramembrane glutamic endopeptidase [Cyclobacteriaceae bacterium]
MLQPQNLVSDKRPIFSLFNISVNLLLGFLLIGPLIGLGIASLFYEGNLVNDIMNMTDENNLFYPLLITQGIGSFIGLIVLPYIHIRTIEQKKLAPFFKREPRLLFVFIIVAIIGFNFIIAISPVTEWNVNVHFPDFLKEFEEWAKSREDQNALITKAVTSFTSFGDLMLCLLVVAIFPAIGEELVFRGMIQNEIWRGSRNIHVAIWISAVIFSAVHFQFFGFFPRLFLGALFGYLYYWSGNLAVPMFAHFFNNGFSVVAMFLYNRGTLETDLEKTESAPWQAVLVSAAVTSCLLYYLWKFFNDRRTIETEESSSSL